MRRLYREIAAILVARENCLKSHNNEWFDEHGAHLDALIGSMPSGGGIDCGTKLDHDKSGPNKLVFHCSYHHMNDCGMYDGWTEHTITVTPSFDGIDIRISGRNRNNIKDYLHETYYRALEEEIAIV